MIKSVINFEDIRSIVAAADHMQLAGKHEEARKILVALAEDIGKNLK